MVAERVRKVSSFIHREREWIVSFLAIEAANLALILTVLKPGYIINADHPCRLSEAWYVAEVLVPRYNRLMGWDPFLFAGFPVLKLGPSFFGIFLVVSIYYLTLRLSIVLAYNMVIAGVYLLFPASIYFFTRKLGLDWHAAAATSVFACFTAGPFPNFVYFSPFTTIFVVGVWPFTLGLTLAFMATAKLIDCLEAKSIKDLLLTSILASLVALTNILTAFMLGVLCLAYIGSKLIQAHSLKGVFVFSKNLLLSGLIVLIALVLAAFWVFPFVASRDYWLLLYVEPPYEPERTWVTLYPFVMPFAPQLSSAPGGWIFQYFYDYSFVTIWALGMMGFIWSLRKWKSKMLMLVIALFFGLVFARGNFSPPVTQCLRFLDFVKVIWFYFAGFFVHEASGFLGSKVAKWIAPEDVAFKRVVTVNFMILIVALGIWLPYLDFSRYIGLVQTSGSNELMTSVHKVYDWLSLNAVEGSTIFFEDTTFWDNKVEPFNPLWFAHAFGAAPMFTGHPNYGGFYGFWYRPYNDVWGDLIWGIYDASSNEAHRKFVFYNIKYVVGFSEPLRQILSDSTFFTEKIGNPFYVYEVLDYTPSYAFVDGGDGKAIVKEFSAAKVVIDAKAADGDASLVLRVSAFPNWKAYVNGEEVPIREYWPNFMTVSLPKGDSEIIFQWEDTIPDFLTRTASILSWVTVLVGFIFLSLKKDSFKIKIRRRKDRVVETS